MTNNPTRCTKDCSKTTTAKNNNNTTQQSQIKTLRFTAYTGYDVMPLKRKGPLSALTRLRVSCHESERHILCPKLGPKCFALERLSLVLFGTSTIINNTAGVA